MARFASLSARFSASPRPMDLSIRCCRSALSPALWTVLLAAPAAAQHGPPRVDVPPTEELLGGVRFAEYGLKRQIDEAVREAGVAEEIADLRARLARLAETADPSRLSAVNLALREPFRVPALAEALAEGFERDALRRAQDGELAGALAHAAFALDRGPLPDVAPAPLPTGVSPEEHLDALQALLEGAAARVEDALAPLEPEEREHLVAHWRELQARFEERIYLHDDPDEERRLANVRTIRAAERIDVPRMLAAARMLSPLASREWAEALKGDLARAGLDLARPVVLRRETPFGAIVIAGTGDDVERSGDQSTDALPAELEAIRIDLGGDDFYCGTQGSTLNQVGRPVLPVGVVIDLAGDDAYESTHDGAQGVGVLGVGLLVDHAGDDGYTGLRFAQGAALGGVGILIDAEGDDVYRARAIAQGAAAWGFALCTDLDGDDEYSADRYGQGVGLAGGLGVLVERAGDDRYYCKGAHLSGYGTAGVFEGWGQGCGVGFRTLASGGVALLVDEDGADRYEAGNFAQGGGYYFGLGALLDRGKRDDRYVGSRYDQGFSAHQAVGYFREEGGDDVYLTRNAVVSGLAWDESVSFFVEDAGDDVYAGGGFSCGASAHNAICVFHEKAGDDTYRRGPFASAGPNDYHGGASLSFLLDARGRDRWPGEDRNGTRSAAGSLGAHGFLVDR